MPPPARINHLGPVECTKRSSPPAPDLAPYPLRREGPMVNGNEVCNAYGCIAPAHCSLRRACLASGWVGCRGCRWRRRGGAFPRGLVLSGVGCGGGCDCLADCFAGGCVGCCSGCGGLARRCVGNCFAGGCVGGCGGGGGWARRCAVGAFSKGFAANFATAGVCGMGGGGAGAVEEVAFPM